MCSGGVIVTIELEVYDSLLLHGGALQVSRSVLSLHVGHPYHLQRDSGDFRNYHKVNLSIDEIGLTHLCMEAGKTIVW